MRSGDDLNKTDEAPGDATAGKRAGRRAGGDRDMGAALRKVYQHTVDETIPVEMLDLLGKLD